MCSELSMRSEKGRRLGGGHLGIDHLCRVFGTRWRVGVVGAAASDTRHDSMWAGAALRRAGRGRASVLPG
jgi:hypothetical protein